MRRLIIRNIGPIKSVDIRLNKVNVFIGPQGSGKSTIAKIISFCSWLEKVNEATERAASDGLIKRLSKFHHMDEYFTEKSVILYVGDNVVFSYNWKIRMLSLYRSHSANLIRVVLIGRNSYSRLSTRW